MDRYEQIKELLDEMSDDEFAQMIWRANNRRKIKLVDGEVESLVIPGCKNPCGCGSNTFHIESIGSSFIGVCNACGVDIYDVFDEEDFDEWIYKEGCIVDIIISEEDEDPAE